MWQALCKKRGQPYPCNSTKQIASELFISVKTVEAHRANIMQKLKISNLPGLTKYAIRNGYTSIDI